jgi:sugar lactone lactonase YvrE
MGTIEDVLNQLRAEFMEMPGMRLHAKQIQRLCGIDQTTCQLALDSLLTSNFLCLKPDGAYVRATDGYHPHRVPVKATVGNATTKAERMSRSACPASHHEAGTVGG